MKQHRAHTPKMSSELWWDYFFHTVLPSLLHSTQTIDTQASKLKDAPNYRPHTKPIYESKLQEFPFNSSAGMPSKRWLVLEKLFKN